MKPLAAAWRCARIGDDIMTLTRFVTSTAIAAALLMPSVAAFAQDSYYIVQDMKTKKCTILDKKPVASEATVVGPDGTVYKTRTEAENAMKTVKVCTST
jgi:hypothetical protein